MWLYLVSFEMAFQEYQESKRQISAGAKHLKSPKTVVSVWSQLKQMKPVCLTVIEEE